MSDTTCGIIGCARPAHDSTICAQHTWELDRRLREIPALLADLDISLSRQGKSGPTTERVGGKGETPVSFNTNASAAQTGLREALIHWAKATGMPWAAYGTTAAAHLLQRLPTLGSYGDLPALFAAVNDAYWTAVRAVDAPVNRTIIPVGPCPEDTDGQPCAGQVQAFIPADDRPARMACTLGEGHYWPSIQWLRTGKRIREVAARHGWAARALASTLTPAAITHAIEVQAAQDRLRMVAPDVAAALADVARREAVNRQRGTRIEPLLLAYRQVYDDIVRGTWQAPVAS